MQWLGVDQRSNTVNARIGRHLQGESSGTRNPGLKPWAVLSDPPRRIKRRLPDISQTQTKEAPVIRSNFAE
jgi:hypothetical protein